MEDRLVELLEGLGYTVRRQGSVTEEYPDAFYTFWQIDSPDHAYYDNTDYGTAWAFNVFAYSINPALTYQMITDAREALKAAGWIVPSKGSDATSDEPTHTGRVLNVYFLET